MPLSPHHLVAIHHDVPMSRGIKPVRYVEAWPQTVMAMNRRAVLHSKESIVCSSNAFDPSWIV